MHLGNNFCRVFTLCPCETLGKLKSIMDAGAESSLAGAEQQWNDAMKVIEDKLQVRLVVHYAHISTSTYIHA